LVKLALSSVTFFGDNDQIKWRFAVGVNRTVPCVSRKSWTTNLVGRNRVAINWMALYLCFNDFSWLFWGRGTKTNSPVYL